MCKEDKMICSNEGKTYPTICSLNEESIERGDPGAYSPNLYMEYWGPCKEGVEKYTIHSVYARNVFMVLKIEIRTKFF